MTESSKTVGIAASAGAAVVVVCLLVALSARESPPAPAAAAPEPTPEKARAAELQAAIASASRPGLSAMFVDIVAEAYDTNELAADAKFKGKWLLMRGRVRAIAKDVTGRPYIGFDHPGRIMGTVQCYLAPEAIDAASRVDPGDDVRLLGRGRGKFGTVAFEECLVMQ